mgnify:CR=1 FL=1
MNLQQYIFARREANVDLSDHNAIAQSHNALPTRYKETWVTPESLISKLGPEVAGRVLVGLDTASETDPIVRWATDRLRNTERGLNAGDPSTRQVVKQLKDDGVFTASDTDAMLAIAQDTHGGDSSVQDVADAITELERNDAIAEASAALDAARQSGAVQADQKPYDKAAIRTAVVDSLNVWVEG